MHPRAISLCAAAVSAAFAPSPVPPCGCVMAVFGLCEPFFYFVKQEDYLARGVPSPVRSMCKRIIAHASHRTCLWRIEDYEKIGEQPFRQRGTKMARPNNAHASTSRMLVERAVERHVRNPEAVSRLPHAQSLLQDEVQRIGQALPIQYSLRLRRIRFFLAKGKAGLRWLAQGISASHSFSCRSFPSTFCFAMLFCAMKIYKRL